jgi:hypothetical protein
MAEDLGFKLLDESLFSNRQYNWVKKIDEDVVNKLLPLLYLVNNDPKSQMHGYGLQGYL